MVSRACTEPAWTAPDTRRHRASPLLYNALFIVAIVKFMSNRVRVEEAGGPTLGGSMYAAQLLKRYPKGATVTVYYNPQNPKESALER